MKENRLSERGKILLKGEKFSFSPLLWDFNWFDVLR